MKDRTKVKVWIGCLVVGVLTTGMIGVLMLIANHTHNDYEKQKFVAVFGVSPTVDDRHLVGAVVSAHLLDLDSFCLQKTSSLQQISHMPRNVYVPPLSAEEQRHLGEAVFYASLDADAAKARLASATKLAEQFGY